MVPLFPYEEKEKLTEKANPAGCREGEFLTKRGIP